MHASVVVPTYERPAKLERTLDSVCEQTADAYEVIVVDDGSESDAQDAVLDRYAGRDRVTVLRQANAGPATARNRGWRAADGEYVLFTDDDCIVPETWVEELVDAFEPGVAVGGGDLVPIADLLPDNPFARTHRLRDELDYDAPDGPVRGHEALNVGGTANVGYRRSVLAEVDGFDESFPLAAGEDADLYRRVLDAGYDAKYVPITVRHNDDYNWQSFTSRAIRFGEGTCHLHRKHGSQRSAARIAAGLIGSPIFFPAALARSRDPVSSALYVAERILSRWGELRCALSR
ncbi:glycosyltransferase [Halobaculum rubrum]|uniref:glycosyltransferase n=1 Tax=Halobaculum rubrum TaxID=2872158 RepID=UPI001CA3C405|nr:glycosyltransferase [Halobaculum rubrum]QZX99911.1 glycosyltransferase family 2 protein [Halobaculum rubrum]